WLSLGSRIWLAAAPVDMRLGFDGLAAKVQGMLAADPFCSHAFVFRNRRGDRLKLLLWDGSGCLIHGFNLRYSVNRTSRCASIQVRTGSNRFRGET
ncbi:IS66 family insertion sequence element accessory protein TnpB, partial [Acidithiobacillus ferrivorans]